VDGYPMDIEPSRIKTLVERPGESLSVELKRWIDPDQPEGMAIIVRAALALRNHNGGYIVIGFDNKTLEPDEENRPVDVKSAFHIDKIQGLISRFASEPFEVTIEFPERNGQSYPVIVIPPGVKTPVASKSDLQAADGNKLITTDDVYVRSLRANNTPSTAKAKWKDWPTLVEVCFDNREADIGRFLRRHLGGATPQVLTNIVAALARGVDSEVTAAERLAGAQAERESDAAISKDVMSQATSEESLREYLHQSEERFHTVVQERALQLPEHGAWEVALLLIGQVPKHSANREFLNLLDSSNPNYTGWPVWLNSRGFSDKGARPYVYQGTWEALVVSLGEDVFFDDIDFMRLDPRGRFYLRRALRDDISASRRQLKPFSVLDFGFPVVRSAEALAVGIAFAKAMGCNPETTLLAFAFRWTRLRGRELASWAEPMRHISPGRHAYQDDVAAFVSVPLDTPLSAIGQFVNQAVQPLFEVFDGFVLSEGVVEELTRRVIARRL
jgi:hypothetical protein